MPKDWKGNRKTQFTTLGSSSHSEGEREENDYYATEPLATELLLQEETFKKYIREPACGQGHMAITLGLNDYIVKSSDLIDRGFGEGGVDFLSPDITERKGDIVTNPPYKYASEFLLKALEIVDRGSKVAMFLRIQFLESQQRRVLFKKNPPKVVYVASKRLKCAINGDFEGSGASAACYARFVWQKGYTGDTVLKWIN